MTKIKVAFQGELGAYSHIAVNKIFNDAEIKTCSTFEETFKTAFEDESYKIVIPLENSLAGRVADIHYLLPKYKLQIHGEHFQTVEHNLIARPESEMKDFKSFENYRIPSSYFKADFPNFRNDAFMACCPCRS